MNERLNITEIFLSLQGESTLVGLPTVFVRLTGCPLRCHYCDTAYAFYGGKRQSLDEIQHAIRAYGVKNVLITGGEPLAQPASLLLMSALCDTGFQVSIETSGALSVKKIDPRVIKVMDIKTPSSGESERNLYTNLAHLTKQDQIKFVISDKTDYDWAVRCLHQHALLEKQVLFSPAYSQLSPTQLAEWILADRLPVRFQIQLHKLLWGEKPGV